MLAESRVLCVSPDLRPGTIPIIESLGRLGLLERFITTLAFYPGGNLDACLSVLPFGSRAKQALARRDLSNRWRGPVSTYPTRELVRAGFAHFWADEILLDRIWWWAERGFDRKVAREWAGSTTFLYGFELASAETFRAQKRAGGKTILNQLIAHHKTALGLMKEELEKYPDVVTDYDRHLVKSSGRVNDLKDEQFALSDLIIANSEFVRQSFVDAGLPGEKIVVIPGAGPKSVKLLPENRLRDRVIFLSAGSQSIRKGTPYLLQAWRKLKTHAGAELWIVGHNTLPARLLDDLPGTVVIKPTVTQAELFEIYAKSSVLVLPSLCEGFALVILEAMAHGLPIITTANSGCGDFVQDGVNGWIVPIRDADALARRMVWFRDNADRLSEMGDASNRMAAKWTWDDYSEVHGQTVHSFVMGAPNEIVKGTEGKKTLAYA